MMRIKLICLPCKLPKREPTELSVISNFYQLAAGSNQGYYKAHFIISLIELKMYRSICQGFNHFMKYRKYKKFMPLFVHVHPNMVSSPQRIENVCSKVGRNKHSLDHKVTCDGDYDNKN